MTLGSVFAAFGGGSAPSAGAASPASKTPVKVMQMASYNNPGFSDPESAAAAKAAAAMINANGGIGGHPIDLLTCDTDIDPNLSADCVQSAIDDKVIAVVGSTAFFPTMLSKLNKAGIAFIGGLGLTQAEYVQPNSFPLAGQPGWFVGLAAQQLAAGAKKPSLIVPDSAASLGIALYKNAFKGTGITPRVITYPFSSTDMTAPATQAAAGSDYIATAAATGTFTTLIKAIQQTGYKGPISVVSTNIPPDAFTALKSQLQGLHIVGLVEPTTGSSPQMKQFKASMAKYQPSARIDELSATSWWATTLLAKVSDKLPTVNAASVLNAFRSLALGSVVTGMTAPVAVAKQTPLAGYPQLAFDPTVYFSVVKGTGFVAQGGPVNPFALLKAKRQK
jgi:ABC-type branched-subunit amino acid transport system substrate-binding protein